MNKLYIIDRDGVLNVNSKDITSPYYYIINNKDLILKPMAKEALYKLKSYKVVLATRQKCISKGLISFEQVGKLNEYLCKLLEFKFDRIYVQPHGDDKTEIFKQIMQDYKANEYILYDDSERECLAAQNLGINAILTDNLYDSLNK